MFLYPFIAGAWKKITRNAEVLITPSYFLKKSIEAIDRGATLNTIQVIPNGIKKNKFHPAVKRPIILTICRLTKQKGVVDLLEAIAQIELKNWQVVIVGDGPERLALEKYSAQKGISESVKFTGWLDNSSAQFNKIIAEASIYVLPSYKENFNTTLIEAMQTGCAIVAADTGGNREVIRDAGVTYKPGDVQNLKNILKKLTSDKTKRINLSKIARERSTNLTIEATADQYIDVIKQYGKNTSSH